MAGYESIASTALGSDTATVTFTSIPATYEYLEIRTFVRGSAGAMLTMKLNNIAFSYNNHWLSGDTFSANHNGNNGNYAELGYSSDSGATSTLFGCSVTQIFDYANTNKMTTVTTLSGIDNNGAGYVNFASASNGTTNAINRVDIQFVTGNVKAGSVISLYGYRS